MKIVKMSVLVLFHPAVAFTYIQKERKSFSWFPVVLLLTLGVAIRLFSLEFTHFPLSNITARSNLLLEVAKLFIPLISWGICSYLMTTILDGETLFRESMLAVSYALVPYILFMIPLTLLSRILDVSQAGLYSTLETVILGWVILLIIISLREMNHFTIGKTVEVVLLSLFTVAILWAAVALLYSICTQFIDFVREVLTEFRYKF